MWGGGITKDWEKGRERQRLSTHGTRLNPSFNLSGPQTKEEWGLYGELIVVWRSISLASAFSAERTPSKCRLSPSFCLALPWHLQVSIAQPAFTLKEHDRQTPHMQLQLNWLQNQIALSPGGSASVMRDPCTHSHKSVSVVEIHSSGSTIPYLQSEFVNSSEKISVWNCFGYYGIHRRCVKPSLPLANYRQVGEDGRTSTFLWTSHLKNQDCLCFGLTSWLPLILQTLVSRQTPRFVRFNTSIKETKLRKSA